MMTLECTPFLIEKSVQIHLGSRYWLPRLEKFESPYHEVSGHDEIKIGQMALGPIAD